MITNPEFRVKVQEIYEGERSNGMEEYERFKVRCVESAKKIRKIETRKKKKNKTSIIKRIEEMRKILR